ncbi:hypothetical protein I3N88_RS22925 [Escherichia coli]|nr:hypothetical protein [Escherichia coli]
MTAFKENALNAGELASCDRVSLMRLIPSIILVYESLAIVPNGTTIVLYNTK